MREEFACGGGRRDRGGVEAEPAEDGVCRGAAVCGVDEVELNVSFEPPDQPDSSREGGERAGVEERASVAVENVDALSPGEAVPIEAVEGDVVGETVVNSLSTICKSLMHTK